MSCNVKSTKTMTMCPITRAKLDFRGFLNVLRKQLFSTIFRVEDQLVNTLHSRDSSAAFLPNEG